MPPELPCKQERAGYVAPAYAAVDPWFRGQGPTSLVDVAFANQIHGAR